MVRYTFSTILLAPTFIQAAMGPGSLSFVAPSAFPTSAFSSYYFLPSSPTQQPQPAIYDPVLKITFPYNLTNPTTIPTVASDPIFFPVPTSSVAPSASATILSQAISRFEAVLTNSSYANNCTKCIAAVEIASQAANLVPSLIPNALVSLCQKYKYASNFSCVSNYAATNYGAIWTQVLALGNMSGLDGQYVCSSLRFCPRPFTPFLNITDLFPKPKPLNATAPKRNGNMTKVLHMSDFHLDPRYSVGTEGNCTTTLCCRSNALNSNAKNASIFLPAPYYGTFQCDSPYGLGLAALQAIGPLTGTNSTNPLGFSIYTGDLVSHDDQNELSQAYVEYTETSVYALFKHFLTGPVFAALGNHDTNPDAQNAPYSLPGPLSTQMSWNYHHVAGLWLNQSWLDFSDAVEAATHYGGYSVKNHLGLRIISFNTDFWLRNNYFNFINTTNPDVSGQFKWMIDELQAAEDNGERVWIIGHVLSGWDGTNPLPAATNLFYQIVDRYSPHVIANIFFGHTHEDQFMIYYANNGTVQDASTALNTGWIGPSITPLTNLNSGFRLYEVDQGDWNVYNAYTFYSNVSLYTGLNASLTGPTWQLEYSTRDAYGPAANWSINDPLNATFWHQVTVAMERNSSLVTLQNKYMGKMSNLSPNCTNSACATARICYMRSGSVALGSQCPQGYGSVQSKFSPPSLQ